MIDRAIWRFVLALGLAFIGIGMFLGMLAGSQGEVYAAWGPSSDEPAASSLSALSSPGEGGRAAPPAAPLLQSANVITVCHSGCPYTSVQAAVNAVAPGGTVKVAQGVYTDTDGDGRVVYITQTLTLQGGYTTTNWTTPNPELYPTVLDGEGTARVVHIADGVAPVVAGFHIRNGSAAYGAGFYIVGGTPSLHRNRVYSNAATFSGGGVYIAGGEPVLENNLIYTNTAAQRRGGGVYIADGAPLLRHNTFYDNLANDEGGGIYVQSGSPVVSATIAVSNTASDGGGIYGYGGTPALDYNDVWGNSGGDYGGGASAGTHSISTDPLFVNPAGGNFYLQAGSPCIDRVPITQTVEVDYEGRARPFGEQGDIGAYEFYTGTCFVRVDAGRVYTTVQAAVDAATDGAHILVAGVCRGVLSRTVGANTLSQTVYINQGLTLQGGYTVTNWSTSDPNANPTILDAQGQGRVIYIDSPSAVVVEGFHIRNGHLSSALDNGGGLYIANGDHVVWGNKIYSNTVGNNGGGIFVANGNPTIQGNDIYSNTANGADGTDGGGGIYITTGSAVVEDNDLYSNAAAQDGGGINIQAGNALVRHNDIHTNTADSTVYSTGGGIYVGGGDPVLQDNNIYENAASSGGGIYIENGGATVQGNHIYANITESGGGGVRVENGSAMVEYNVIYSNTVTSSSGGGGGIYLRKASDTTTATVRYNVIYSNTARVGGGIDAGEGIVIIENNHIYDNSATGAIGGCSGGGILAWSNTKIIRRNAIHDNTANGPGGGIAFNTAGGTVENNLIYGNAASTSNGGGIYISNASPTMQNNTIYGNTAQSNGGGGIYMSSGSPTIRNNIIVSNTNYGIYGSVTATYCDVWGNGSGNYGGGAIAGTGTITANPQFVSPGVDFHLQAGSPCRDVADPNNYSPVDYDGYDRPFGSRADMGAYEFYTGSCFAQIDGATRVYTTVQAAVDAAGAGELVKVAGICTGVETRAGLSQTVYLSSALTLRGGYTLTNWITPTAVTVLDPQGAGRGVYITGTNGIVIDGFLIRHGSAVTGGGLYVAAAVSPTVQNVVFYSNTADYGGGLASAGGNPRLFNNTFVTNTATYSGGAAYFDAGSPVIRNNIIVSNTAASGGGLFATANVALTPSYNDIWGNAGGNYAGNVTTGTTDFSTDPLFMDFAAADFHLRADSPCIHTGDPNTTVGQDFEGDERPLGRGYDVGADESADYPDVLFSPDRQANGIPDQAVVYIHFLTNTGSITSSFDITHSLTVSGTGGWGVEYPAAFTLAAGEGVHVPVTVTVPAEAISGTYAIVVLTATSGVNSTIFDLVTNTTLVNWNPGVDVTPSYDEHLNPGTVVTYEHIVRNTGNATDTFDVTWTGSRGWTEAVTPDKIMDLGPQQTTSLWVRVAIPATAPGGLTETTLITLTSPSSGAQGTVTDTFGTNHTVGSRYVATTGDDTLNNCLVYTTPCRTIAHAVGQAAGGDLIAVAAGTYYEHDITLNKDITLRGGYTTTNWMDADPPANPTVIDAQGLGRVLYIFGQPTVEGLTLQGGSTAGSGGGVYIYSLGSPVLRDNVITGNVASVYGGGIYNEMGNVIVERNVLAFNTADRGGGFASASGQPGFWNNAVYKNTANADGGGIYAAGGSPRIWHDTLYDNSAERGGGAFLAGGTPVLSNTIVVSNTASVTAGGVYSQAAGAQVDYNDVWGNTGGDYTGLSGGSHSISENPLFMDAKAANFHLQENSPCIDAGSETDLAQDVDGQPRTMGSAPDMGLDEFVRPGVQLEPDRTGKDVPGTVLYYYHVLTNTGTYTDTYNLSLSGWGSIDGPSSVTLGAGLTQTVIVRVEVPAALSGTVGTSVLTATSTINPAVSDTAVDTTTVGLAAGLLLEPDRVREASSAPPGTVAVTYTHFLTNTGNTTDTFALSGTSDQGWAVSVAPTTVTLDSGTFTTVRVTVTIPAISTDTVRVDTTFVTATSQTVITFSAQVTDTTYVNRRPGVALAPDRAATAPPGQTVVYHHILTNTGNVTDTFSFTSISSQNWNVTVPPPQTLGPGLTRTVGVTIAVPAGAMSDTVDTTLVAATSSISPAIAAHVVDTTTVEQVPNVLLEPALDIVGICVQSPPTQVITYSFDLTNKGNYTDTFDLTGQSSQGWNVTLVPLSATLYAEGSTVVQATLEVPSTTARLVDTTTVTATSRADPSTWDTAFYVTRVNWDIDVVLEPNRTGTLILGNTIRYTHTVTNTGEETNTIELTWQNLDGWPVSVSPSLIQDLAPGAAVTVEVIVTVPPNIIDATNQTLITATTQFYCVASDAAVDTTRVTRPDVALYPDLDQNAPPGTVVTYTHSIRNSGAVTDTYTITYSSSLGWPAMVTPTTVYNLSPGAEALVTVTVAVPGGVVSNTSDLLVITATSQYADTIFDTAQDKTTAAYFPSAVLAPNRSGQADAGGFTSYTHTLTNTGNYTDTFYLNTWSEFANATVAPSSVELGPGEAYSPVVVTVLLPPQSAAGEVERTEVIASFAGRQAVAVDLTQVNLITGTRYVAPGGTDENNNCTVPADYGPCATPQHAVEQAGDGDEIRVAQGVYTDVHTIGGITQVIRVDKSLVLRGGYTPEDWNTSDPVARPTVLDAGGQGRVVYMVGAGITPVLEGFHLRGGFAGGTDNAGAGLHIAAGVVPTIRRNWIYNNTAVGNESKGGGIYYGGEDVPLLDRNTVYSNTAEDGGGLYLTGGSPRVWNNVIYHNTAIKQGGGLYAGGSPLVWNATIYSNTAEGGGGIYLLGGTPVVSNTIVVGNSATATGGGIYNAGGTPTLAYNDVWDNSGGNYSGVTPDANSISADPYFVDTVVPDLRLTGASSCIDAGDPNTALTLDREGNPRPLLSGYDIGAYEYGLVSVKQVTATALPGTVITYTITVTNTGDLASTIPVTDTLHPYLDYAGLLTYTVGNGEYVTATRTISWTGDVPGNSTVFITFTARITDWVAAGVPITNVAWVDYARTDVVTTTVTALPGTRYVTAEGEDTDNSCRMVWWPCRTVQWAVDQALVGDGVLVATGTYTDALGAGQVVSISKSITLTGGYTTTTWAYDPEAYPTILSGQNAGQGVVITGPVTVTVAGLRVEHATDGLAIYTATAVITRCRVYNSADDGIHVTGGNLTLARTWVYSNTGDGVEVTDGNYALVNDIIAHNTGAGLRTAGSEGVLKHNTFARNDVAGAIVGNMARFTNTIFYSHTVGVSVTASSTAYLSYTVWYSNTANEVAGTLISSTNYYSDPLFYDPDGLDYHIQSGSGALDAGVEAGVGEDIDGGLRPLLAGPDVGADEFPLSVTKQAPDTARPEQVITYTIVLEGDAGDLVLTDTLPLYVDYVGSLICTGGTCGYLSTMRAVTWTGSISVGHSVFITYTAQITDWLAAGVQVLNDAQVQLGNDVLYSAPAATTILAKPGPRYVTASGDDTDNNCLRQDRPCATVQWAVDQALAGDEVLVAMGTYTDALGAGQVVSVTKSITLTGGYTTTNWTTPNPTVYPTYLDGEGNGRAMVITGPVTVTVDGFRLVGGFANDDGGGLYVYTATVTLANAEVYNNTASGVGHRGGGIYQDGGSLTITATQVYSNTSVNDTGGGIYHRDGTFALLDSRVYSNTAGSGGGLYLTHADVTLAGSLVYTNTAGGNGGGVNVYQCGRVLLENNFILDNAAGSGTTDKGGGLYVQATASTVLTLTNNIVAANRAGGGGDGLYLWGAGSAQGLLRHNTVADNADEGLRVGDFTLVLTDTILVGHTVGITTSATGASVTADHTLWYATATYTDTSGGGSIVTTNDRTGDPKFVAPAALDYHIRGDSAALDAGVWAGVGRDIDGDVRPVGQAPDIGADQYPLRVARWATPSIAHPCQVVTHTLQLTNLRPTPMSGVSLTDTLDANVVWAGFTASSVGSVGYVTTSHIVTWTGPVAFGTPTLITYTARITPYLPSGTVLTHSATISDAISIFDTTPITVMVATQQAALEKSGPAQATIGQMVTYTIAFTVPEGHVAYRPIVTDTLPRLVTGAGISTTPALTYVVGSGTPSPATVSPDGGTITWTLSTVTATCDAPAVVTVTFTAQVRNLPDNGAGDLLTNTAVLSYTEATADGPVRLVTTAQAATLVEPEPTLVKAMEPETGAGSGDLLTVTLTLTNTGASPLYDVVVTDTLPDELTFLDATAPYNRSGRVITWTADSLDAGQHIAYTITARVTDTVGSGVLLPNTAGVIGDSRPGAVDEERLYTDAAQATATSGYPDLLIVKERGPAVRSPGQPITYLITYTNTGVVRAEGVRITDTLPTLLTDVISATSTGAAVEHGGRTVTWTLSAPLERGTGGIIWITGTVSSAAGEGAVLTNTAGITTTTAEQNTANNVASATTTVHLPVLVITKTAEPAALLPGGLLTYTLTISNAGLGEALDLVISDTVPESIAYVSCAGGDTCGESGGVVTWAVAHLRSGEQVQVSFTARVDTGVDPDVPIRNQSYSVTCLQGISASGLPVETPIGCVPVSIVDLTFSPSAPLIGQTVTFSGTVASESTPPLDYTWDFGDGSRTERTGVQESTSVVTHTYTDDGSYTAILTVTNGCGSVSRQQEVFVNPYRIYLPLVLRNR